MPRLFCLFLFVSMLCLPAGEAGAAGRHLFKIASLAPAGSVWAQRFDDFVREVEEKTGGEVRFKVYPGGVMGNEQAVYRKMRVGQLQGGGFTMTGIGEVVPDFRVMGIPFLFSSYEEVDAVKEGLWPHFHKAFEEQGLTLLALSEVGFVYAMSSKPVSSLEGLRASKNWFPEGDAVSAAYLETIQVHGVPLGIPDVLTSLQTGLVETVFNSFYGSVVLQWFTKARYVADFPFGYGYGAFLVDSRAFAKLPPEYQKLMEEAARKHFDVLLLDTRKSNAEALDALRQNGVELLPVDEASRAELQAHREETIGRLLGSAFSRQIYEETARLLEAYRQQAR